MGEENKPYDGPPLPGNDVVDAPAGKARSAPESGFRDWIAGNEKFIRALMMIGAYAFGMLFLISIFALGGIRPISGIFAGIFIASLTIMCALPGIRHRQ